MSRQTVQKPIGTISAALCIALTGVGCKTSSSGADREANEQESREIERRNRVLEQADRIDQRAWQAFTDRFKGQIESGVGCDACPNTCDIVDLSAMEADAFQQAYRQMVIDLTTSHDDHLMTVAMYEHQRLLCILRSETSMRRALVPLFDPGEFPAVRYHAAIDAAQLGLGTSEPRRVLNDVAKGSDFTAGLARLRIELWNKEGWPGE